MSGTPKNTIFALKCTDLKHKNLSTPGNERPSSSIGWCRVVIPSDVTVRGSMHGEDADVAPCVSGRQDV